MSGEVSSMIDLNDADILRLEDVLRHLNKNQGQRRDMESFRKEVIERFGLAGFRVEVKTWSTTRDGVSEVEGLYGFEIEIRQRLEGKFDPDQMVHETVSDVLGLGTGGVINTSKLWTPPSHKAH